MKIHFNNINKELTAVPQWLCWVYEENPSNPDHPKKPPIDPKTGKAASVTDPDTWGTYDQAIAHYNKGDVEGIGIVFTANDSITGIDVDNCRNPKTGKITARAQKIINIFSSYAEVSPSGEGVHIIIKGKLPGAGINVGGVEIYDDAHYFTFTGNQVPGTPMAIKKCQKKLTALYKKLLATKKLKASEKKAASKTQPVSNQGSVKPDGMTDAQIITKVMLSGNGDKFSELMGGNWQSGYKSHSEADLGFCSFLSKFTDSEKTIDSIFRGSGLMRPKWDEQHGGKTYGEQTIFTVLSNPNVSYGHVVTKETSQFEIVQQVVKQIGRENITMHANQFWHWNKKKGVWRAVEDRAIKKLIQGIVHQKSTNRSQIDSILDLLKTEVHSATNRFDKNDSRIINCLNVELHFEDGEWVQKPHNRKSYFTLQIPVKFRKNAKRERFWKFVNEIFKNDPDKKAKIMLLQEFMGYALTRSCEYERFLLLIGNGKNGKTVLLKVIVALLGSQNVAGVQPNQLENRFQLAHLRGKLANIITEIPLGAVIADAKLKALVSGELMTAEHKFGHPFDFKPHATMFFAANHLPHTKDYSDAFFRRAEILTFNRKFDGKECDPLLEKKLLEELPGILNFALAGLKRLYLTGDFTKVQCSQHAKKEWELEADQVAAFVNDECVLEPSAKVVIADLFKRYTAWAEETGVKTTVKQSQMNKRLERLGCERKPGSKGAWTIYGIKLRPAA